VQKEIVKAGRSADVRVYFVWLPMLSDDNENEARSIARSLGASRARHFYDPQRRAGIAFVEDHFQGYMREALAELPKEHPLRERLAQRVEASASESPLWDAVMYFAPSAEWNSKSPRPHWWAKQIGFYGEGAPGKPTGQFLRNQIEDGPVESDWFAETREGMRTMTRQETQ